MPVDYKNLSGYVKNLIAGGYPEVGQLFWVVDSNYRTHAQGWSKADHTGPIDMHAQRTDGYVFYAPGNQPSGITYSSDRNAIQAAIDAVVDYRGDTVVLTPGSYSIATTALALNAVGMRFIGVPTGAKRQTRTTVTDAIGAGLAATVDDVELAFMKLIPLTATSTATFNAADNAFIHNIYWDADGIAASTLTQGFEFLTAASLNAEIRDCYFFADAAQGPGIDFDYTTAAFAQNLNFFCDSSTWASLMETTANTNGAHVDLVFVNGGVNGTITQAFLGAANTNKQLLATRFYLNGSVCTSMESTYGTTTDIDIAECYTSGDSATEGGALTVLA